MQHVKFRRCFKMTAPELGHVISLNACLLDSSCLLLTSSSSHLGSEGLRHDARSWGSRRQGGDEGQTWEMRKARCLCQISFLWLCSLPFLCPVIPCSSVLTIISVPAVCTAFPSLQCDNNKNSVKTNYHALHEKGQVQYLNFSVCAKRLLWLCSKQICFTNLSA